MNRSLRAGFLSLLMMTMTVPSAARAAPVTLDLPAHSLEASLKAVALAGGLNLEVNHSLVAGKMAPALHGQFEPGDALRHLLAGSGLSAAVTKTSAVISDQTGEINLAPVKIVGVESALGPNGSTDVTATEGTGSYTSDLTTVGSKIPLPLHQIPQSVSVVTQQRIQDQNLDSLYDTLNQTTGITLAAGDAGTGFNYTIYSRGFQINTLQIDGGAPSQFGFRNEPAIDMAEYDHLEVLRGADGMFLGSGNPAGSIDLVRKRPLDHFQAGFDAQAGSWSNFRESADITGPLAFDGKLRGRLVVSQQDQHYFYDVAKLHQTLVYGILEADLTPSTLLTIGGSLHWNPETPWAVGAMRYSTGADLGLPRSQCLCFPWEKNNANNAEAFLKLNQRIDDNWSADLNFTATRQRTNWAYGYILLPVNPVTLSGPLVEEPQGRWQSHNYMLDTTVHGKFELFGQPQELVTGVDLQRQDGFGGSYSNTFFYLPGTVFNFNPYAFPVPAANDNQFGTSQSSLTTIEQQYGWYTTLRVQPFVDWLHLSGGFRLSGYFSPGQNETGIITPYGGASVDLTKNLSVYANYTSIYISQASALQGPLPGTSLAPVTGYEYEAGLKGKLYDGKLNGSVSLYHINQRNNAVSDPNFTPVSLGSFNCCYLAQGNTLSEGADVEVTGQILPDWQIFAGYTYNFNAQRSNVDRSTPNVTLSPKHLFKLWTTYKLPWVLDRRLSVGAGLNAQSSSYSAGSAQVAIDSKGNGIGPSIPYHFTQEGYAVLGLRLAFQVTPNVLTSLNLNNVTDTRYYQTIGTTFDGNWYGAPRNFTFALHVKY